MVSVFVIQLMLLKERKDVTHVVFFLISHFYVLRKSLGPVKFSRGKLIFGQRRKKSRIHYSVGKMYLTNEIIRESNERFRR